MSTQRIDYIGLIYEDFLRSVQDYSAALTEIATLRREERLARARVSMLRRLIAIESARGGQRGVVAGQRRGGRA